MAKKQPIKKTAAKKKSVKKPAKKIKSWYVFSYSCPIFSRFFDSSWNNCVR